MKKNSKIEKSDIWKSATSFLAILLIISIFTSGFGYGSGTETPQLAAQQKENTLIAAGDDLSGTDAFAACLTEKGVTMYGSESCGHCKNQKRIFGDSFKYVNYINCNQDRSICSQAGIPGYPTWKIDGKNYPGMQPLERLASLSGCELS